MSYLQKMLSKNDKELTPEVLESLIPTKKIKKAETDITNDETNKAEAKSPKSPGEITPEEDSMQEEKD